MLTYAAAGYTFIEAIHIGQVQICDVVCPWANSCIILISQRFFVGDPGAEIWLPGGEKSGFKSHFCISYHPKVKGFMRCARKCVNILELDADNLRLKIESGIWGNPSIELVPRAVPVAAS